MAARIVINPSTFKNSKDALCVAFNERFRIAMEQYGFEPQSEPTDKQRRFFADTAYADDEVQLRRTILARILTLDTSVKDPTDEQLQEAVAFLQEFKRRERPSNDWEASAIDRLEVLVQTVVNKGRRAVPKPQGGTVQADIGGGTTEDDEENRQQTQEPEEPEETAGPTDTQEPIEEAAPPTETAEPGQPTEQPAEPATEQPSTEPQVATTEPPSPENLEPGQVITNNGTVTTEEEAQRQADDFKRSLLGDTDNSQDAAITEEPRKPEEASQPPQTQTAETQTQTAQQQQQQAPAQTQQPAQQQAQAKPAAPSATVPQPVHTEGQQPAPGARWTTKSQRKMRRYLRALYGKDYAYAAVYGASAKAPTVQSPAAKPVRATPRRRT